MLKTKIINDALIVYLRGRLDARGCENLSDEMQQLTQKKNYHTLLNMKQLEYMSSSGIGLIVKIKRNVEKNGLKLFLIAPTEAVTRILTIVGMQDTFQIAKTEKEALNSL